jgi:hypothetical protein
MKKILTLMVMAFTLCAAFPAASQDYIISRSITD